MNECLTTSQHKIKSAVGCKTNGIYIKTKLKSNMYILKKGYKQSVKSCAKMSTTDIFK